MSHDIVQKQYEQVQSNPLEIIILKLWEVEQLFTEGKLTLKCTFDANKYRRQLYQLSGFHLALLKLDISLFGSQWD